MTTIVINIKAFKVYIWDYIGYI